MKIQSIGDFFPLAEALSDCLFIVSASFEQRCLGVSARLREKASDSQPQAVLLIKYSDRGDIAIRSRASRYTPQLKSLLSRLALNREIEEQELEPYGLLEGFQFFANFFQTIRSGTNVLVDVSTLTKLHLLYLMEAASRSARVSTLRIAYCRARYGRYDTLSWGAEEPVVLPGFGAPRLESQPSDHLVVFCGLEPDRGYSIWRRFGQSRCTKIFIGTGEEDLDRCAERAKKLNFFAPQAASITLPAFQTQRTTELLHRLYSEGKDRGEYLYVAPMTTKWEVAAVWEFFHNVGPAVNAGIVYAAPGRINASGHTRDDPGECLVAKVW